MMELNGAMQMAIDEAILTARARHKVPNTIRFYTWKPSCVTIGYFQSAQQEVDLEKAKQAGVDVVRRYTGGGAVLHDNEVTYSIVLTESDVPSNIIDSYKKLCLPIVYALRLLGLKAEFAPINDILVSGRKISGNAQTRKQGVVLQHGTLLLKVDIAKMFSLLKVPNEKLRDKVIERASARVTSLEQELGRSVAVDEVIAALEKGFTAVLGISLERGKLTRFESELAKRLAREKYATKEWSFMR